MRDIFLTPDVYSQLLLYVFAERCYASVAFAVMRCLSVCVFVTFLHSVKTNKYLHFFHRRVATPFQFFCTKRIGNIPTGTRLTWASNAGGVG